MSIFCCSNDYNSRANISFDKNPSSWFGDFMLHTFVQYVSSMFFLGLTQPHEWYVPITLSVLHI
jgi:hypothetical protein